MTQEERFRASFDEHYRALARFVRQRGHGSAEADDIVAGTFEVAWRRIDTVPEGHEALPWLLGVARNLSRNAQRKTRREASFVSAVSAVTASGVEMPIDERAAIAEVTGALAKLKPLDRDLILLVAWDELTPAEAGEVLGLRPVTARSRLHRARQRLSAMLKESTEPATGPPPQPHRRSISRRGDRRGR